MSWFTGASDALEQMLVEQETKKRQAMMDALKKQEMDRQFDLDNRREQRMASDSKRNFDGLDFDREAKRVDAAVDDDMPGDVLDDAAAALRKKHGRGGTFRTSTREKVGLIVGPDGVAPGVTAEQQAEQSALPNQITANVASGGARWRDSQARMEASAVQARQAEQAKAERADAERRHEERLANDRNATTKMVAGMRIGAADNKAGSIQYAYDGEGKLVAFRTRGDAIERVEIPEGVVRRNAPPAPALTPAQREANAFSQAFGGGMGRAKAKKEVGGDGFLSSVNKFLNPKSSGAVNATPTAPTAAPGSGTEEVWGRDANNKMVRIK